MIRTLSILIILLSILTVAAYTQNIEATTKDGREVVLRKNGTWKFLKTTPVDKPIKIPPPPSYALPTPEETAAIRGWFSIASTKDTISGFTVYYKLGSLKTDILDNVSGWLRYIPFKPAVFIKKNKFPAKLSYFLQYTSANCNDRRLSKESTVFYDAQENVLKTPYSFFFRSYGEPVVPNSVDEVIWIKMCNFKN